MVVNSLLPPTVRAFEVIGAEQIQHVAKAEIQSNSFPAEAAVVARAVSQRRYEFSAVRRCARKALLELGSEPVPILPTSAGAPRWPAGIVGSMTHCNGYVAAAAAMRSDIASLGIDAEPNAPLPDDVIRVVASPGELRCLHDLAVRDASVCWDRLLFSAKEAIYKAWYPLAEAWLGFNDVELTIDEARRTFSARLLLRGRMFNKRTTSYFNGKWTVGWGLVVTAVVVDP